MIPVTIEIVDDQGTVGMVATFEWFGQKIPGPGRAEQK